MHDKLDRHHTDTHGKLEQLDKKLTILCDHMVAQSDIQVEILQRQLPHAHGH